MSYKTINATNGTINIGYIGDNAAAEIVFSISDIISIYGTSGTFELLVKQQSKNKPPIIYPVTISADMDAETVTWIPTAEDTSSGQYMDVELVYTIDEQVVYNRVYRCVCKKSLAGYERSEAPQASWVTEVLAAASNVNTSATAAAESATTASEAADTATDAASEAAESASAAEDASASAADAQAAAEAAAAEAQTALDGVSVATVSETMEYLNL